MSAPVLFEQWAVTMIRNCLLCCVDRSLQEEEGDVSREFGDRMKESGGENR